MAIVAVVVVALLETIKRFWCSWSDDWRPNNVRSDAGTKRYTRHYDARRWSAANTAIQVTAMR